MGSLLIHERYKVVRAVCAQPDYALLEAVDIADRETPSRLINLFEGELLHRYARICTAIRREDCPAFREMFLEHGTLAVVFDDCAGRGVDSLFFRGDDWTTEERLEFAEMVLHQALSCTNLPPEVGCAAMLSENLRFDLTNRRLASRFMLVPMEGMNQRELVLLASDQVRKILPRSLAAGKRENEFLDTLDAGLFPSMVKLYAYWRETEPEIRAEREEFNGKFAVRRWFIMLGRAIRRAVKREGR